MIKPREYTERECLACALTLLTKYHAFTEEEAVESININGYEGIYNLINERYKALQDN